MKPSSPHHEQLHHLYREHRPWLVGWLRRQTHCAEQAADVSQDTFLQLLGTPTLPELREPRAFLSTIARRLLIRLWRRRDLEQAYLEALAAEPLAHAISEEERALVLERLAQVDKLLSELPLVSRQIFLLNQLYDLPYPEIAKRLGLATITVRRHMKRVLETLCRASL